MWALIVVGLVGLWIAFSEPAGFALLGAAILVLATMSSLTVTVDRQRAQESWSRLHLLDRLRSFSPFRCADLPV
jgi:hypothetical protein